MLFECGEYGTHFPAGRKTAVSDRRVDRRAYPRTDHPVGRSPRFLTPPWVEAGDKSLYPRQEIFLKKRLARVVYRFRSSAAYGTRCGPNAGEPGIRIEWVPRAEGHR